MPLPGGDSDKFGNRYEGRWIVHSIIEVMDERAKSIRIEPPGEEGKGFEFCLRREGTREYHQVKRQNTRGTWTNGALKSRGVLSHFLIKLAEPKAHCVFVSTDRAYELDELSDRARAASNIGEFRKEYLNTDGHRNGFSRLRHYWDGCSESRAFDYLQRIRVETISEQNLNTVNESRIAALVEGKSSTIAAALTQFALDNIGQILTAHEFWNHLKAEGFDRRNWGNDPHVLAKVDVVNQSYLNPLRRSAIGNDFISREEVVQILDHLTTSGARQAVMLVGEAGVGKSGVLYLTATTLIQMGWPLLAFRVDHLQPELLTSAVGVGQLDLPGSPAHVLASVAQGSDCVLLIDQLDAVSFASGRHPEFFNCISEIIAEALAYPKMRVLLASRTFDVQNDHRLRRLSGDNGVADVLEVQSLSREVVGAALESLKLNPAHLNDDQMNLLMVPLHLRLLAESMETTPYAIFAFDSVRDLYDNYWKYKQRAIRNRQGRDVKWITVIDSLCDFMSSNQVMNAPEQVVEDANCWTDAELMASENVLTLEQGRYSFFHETFFDYAFARRFVTRGGDLLALLLSGEQQLFRRAQVRQILAYQREAEFASYLATLEGLLEHPRVRFHLKQVVFALLHQLNEPRDGEWEIIELFLRDIDNPLSWEVWRIIHGSASWFDLLHSRGVPEQWLIDGDNGLANRAVQFLASVQKERPDHVADLVEPFLAHSPDWDDRLVYLSRVSDLSHGRRFFEIFLRLIDSGVLDDIKGFAINSDFWSLIYSLPKSNPEWACEVIKHRLQRLSTIALAGGRTNPFRRDIDILIHSHSGEQVILESAKGAPSAFVTHVLPFMLETIRLNLVTEAESPWEDDIWRYRTFGECYSLESAVLQGMEDAFRALASDEPDFFNAIADNLSALDIETVQYLLVCGYTANPEELADTAVEYLLQNPARLKTGYSQNEHWAARELISALTPYCSDVNLTRLEETLLDYYPPSERDMWGYKYKRFGYAQFVLMEGIDPSRRSANVHRRIQEHRRSGKFDVSSIQLPPEVGEFRQVPPPVPETAAERMTDEQWLQAIAAYTSIDLASRPDVGLIGGADQMSSLLQGRAREEPERFVKLLLRIPDDSNSFYFNAILLGISESQVDADVLSIACQRCHGLPDRPSGHAIATLISKQSRQDLPTEMFDILTWYATQDPDPHPKERKIQIVGQDADHPQTILSSGINSVRGRAAEAMANLIIANSSRCHYFLQALQEMVRDPADSVKAYVAETLVAALNFDRDIAVKLFSQLCEGEDVLLGTRYVERFLYHASTTHYQALESLLSRMLHSSTDEVRTVGARQMTLASLTVEEAGRHVELCLTGSEAQQVGAAEVFASNLHLARFRDTCEDALKLLFNSPHEQVQAAASQCFDRLKEDQLAEHTVLVNEFATSSAFKRNHWHIIRALEITTAKLPEVTLTICETFISVAGAKAGDIRTGAAADSDTVTKLVIRVYSQNEGNEELQSRCLNLIDHMAGLRAYGLDKALLPFER